MKSTRARFTTVLALLIAGLACSGGGGDAGSAPDPFPAELTAADFPGLSYPPAGGDLPRPAGPVWLVAVDGATWDLIRPMAGRGELPHFARLLEEGAHAVLLSEEPTISPALWATVATGVPRFEHGVVNFLVKLPGRYATVEAGPLDRRRPAVWELVGAAGGSSAVVGWFGSFPAEPIAGRYVSKGFDPARPEPQQVWPESLAAELHGHADVRLRDEDVDAIARTNFLRDTLLEDARMLATLRALVANEPSDLVAAYLSGIDVVQHVTWKHMDPASQQFPADGPPDGRLAGVIPAYYRFVDHALGEMLEMAPEGTTFVIVSDHGAGPLEPEQAFHLQLPVLLEAMGLMRGNEGQAFAISELYRHEKRIWINVRGVETTGVVPPEQAREAAEMMRRRLDAMRTNEGARVFASVVNHADEEAWRPGLPALTVRFSVDALFAATVSDGPREIDFSKVRMRQGDVSGGHRPEGIVLLHGPSIRPGALERPANLYQVAPTLLYLLGLPQDGRMLRHAPADGGVLTTAIRPEALERRPVRMIGEYPGTDRLALLRDGEGQRAAALDPAGEASLEKLRSLGYIR